MDTIAYTSGRDINTTGGTMQGQNFTAATYSYDDDKAFTLHYRLNADNDMTDTSHYLTRMGSYNSCGYEIAYGSTGPGLRFRSYYSGGSTTWYIGDSVIHPDEWTMYSFVVSNGTGGYVTAKLYVNGTFWGQNTTLLMDSCSSGQFRINDHDELMNSKSLDGTVDDFLLFNSAQTDEQVATVYGVAQSNASVSLLYDENGNMVYDGQFYREYNGLNQLFRVYNGTDSSAPLLEEYIHDPIAEKIAVKKSYFPNGTLKETVYYISEDYVRVVNTSGTFNYRYVYLDGQLVAQVNPDNSTLYIHGNHEGSSSVVTNSTGQVVENTTYTPFGQVLTGGTKTRFGYEAKEQSVLGDTDFHFRKYLPAYGVFAQPDTRVQGIYNPQSLNRYSFENNDPIYYVDKNGHWLGLAILAVAVIIAVVTVVLKDFQRTTPPVQSQTSAQQSSVPQQTQSSQQNPTSNNVEDRTSLKDDAAEAAMQIAAPEAVEHITHRAAKKTASLASKAIGEIVEESTVAKAGGLTNPVLTVGFGIKDSIESLHILSSYSDEQFTTDFPKYIHKVIRGTNTASDTNVAQQETEYSTSIIDSTGKEKEEVVVRYI